MFLRAASVRGAKRPTSIKHWQERYKTHFGAAARRPKTLKNRSANASNCVGRCERRLRASWEWSQKLLERLWGALGTFLDGSWPLLARPWRPKIAFGVAFGCPKAISSASGRVPETTSAARNGPRSIFLRFGMDFHRFSKDFSLIFVRAAYDEGTKTESQKRVARSSARVLALALCNRFVLLARLSK